MSYLQAIVIAVVQGVTELFPVSSLGHSVLVPAWIGGSWQSLVTQSSQSSSETSFYLAYIVALHVATALALLVFFRADWERIIRGFFRTLGDVVRTRRMPEDDADARLAWLVVIATVPVGITGLALEHVFRTIFAKPVAASIFLFVNGLILFAGERYPPPCFGAGRRPRGRRSPRRRAHAPGHRAGRGLRLAPRARLGRRQRAHRPAAVRGAAARHQPLGHHHGRRPVARPQPRGRGRFAFLLATPVILAAGVLKLPDAFGSAGDHIHGQAAVGFVICGSRPTSRSAGSCATSRPSA